MVGWVGSEIYYAFLLAPYYYVSKSTRLVTILQDVLCFTVGPGKCIGFPINLVGGWAGPSHQGPHIYLRLETDSKVRPSDPKVARAQLSANEGLSRGPG